MNNKQFQLLTEDNSLFPCATPKPVSLVSSIQNFKRNITIDVNILNNEEDKYNNNNQKNVLSSINKNILQLQAGFWKNKMKSINLNSMKTKSHSTYKKIQKKSIKLPNISLNRNFIISNSSRRNLVLSRNCNNLNRNTSNSQSNILFITNNESSDQLTSSHRDLKSQAMKFVRFNTEIDNNINKENTNRKTELSPNKIYFETEENANENISEKYNVKHRHRKINSKKFIEKGRKIICEKLNSIRSDLNTGNDYLINDTKDYTNFNKFMIGKCDEYLKRFDNKYVVDTDEFLDKGNIDRKKYDIQRNLDIFASKSNNLDNISVQNILNELKRIKNPKNKNNVKDRQNRQHNKLIRLLDKNDFAYNRLMYS